MGPPPPTFPFVVGCGRSGSTLLRAMCDAHPALAVPPESHFIVPLAPPGRDAASRPLDVAGFVDRLCANEHFGLWGLERADVAAALESTPPPSYPDAVRRIFALWAEARGKERYADKTPGYVLHIPTLARLFPEAVFIHLIRDGRDVASSFLELGWADRIEDAALHWRLRVRRGRRAGRALPAGRYHELRYEELVADPAAQLRELCAAIELPFSPAMLDPTDRADTVVATTRHPGYHQRVALPPTPGLRNWRVELSEQDIARFELLAGDTLAELGYARAGVRAAATTRREVAGRWVRWQLHRVRRRVGRAA
jgi:Sulfotransferase family